MKEYTQYEIFTINPQQIPNLKDTKFNIIAKGNLNTDNKFITIVGSRKATNYTKIALEKILQKLPKTNITIVSGLALGADTYAHEAALKYDLHTVAVPGSGLDIKVLAPQSNLKLATKILNSNGALLSIHENHTQANRATFPQRNEFMAKLADLVIITECTQKSGTMITARLAKKFNKPIFALPTNITSPLSEGPNTLIKQGAKPITSHKDIIDILNLNNTPSQTRLSISTTESLILNSLETPKTKTQLSGILKLPLPKISQTITKLELSGKVRILGGKIYKL